MLFELISSKSYRVILKYRLLGLNKEQLLLLFVCLPVLVKENTPEQS